MTTLFMKRKVSFSNDYAEEEDVSEEEREKTS